MPNIRVMNWNIEKLGKTKLDVNGMGRALARTVVAADVDILLVLEVVPDSAIYAMEQLSRALNLAEGAARPNAPRVAHRWQGYFLSPKSSTECYGVFIRDLDTVRPVFPDTAKGDEKNPLRDLTDVSFKIWPSPDWTNSAYPISSSPPTFPLCQTYLGEDADSDDSGERPNKRRRHNFPGQSQGNGGFALGLGYRLPVLTMFCVHTRSAEYLIPIVACHHAAVRSGRNGLAQSQIERLKELHIAQLFNGLGASRHIDVLESDSPPKHRPVRVQELCFTGDYNVDFLNNGSNGANDLAAKNYRAYLALTPTQQQGGSATPPALPGEEQKPPDMTRGPVPVAPLPEHHCFPLGLRAAVTTQATILHHYRPKQPPPPPPYTSAAFDNFFYGGTRMSQATIAHGVGNIDSGEVVYVHENIVQQGGEAADRLVDVSQIAAHYFKRGTKNAKHAPGLLQPHSAGTPLNSNDRLIGARFLSDHLPVVIQFECP